MFFFPSCITQLKGILFKHFPWKKKPPKLTLQLPPQLIAGTLLQHAHNLPADDDLVVEQPVQILGIVGRDLSATEDQHQHRQRDPDRHQSTATAGGHS